MADPLTEKLKGINGGRILDVATSHGDFLRLLTKSFTSYDDAIGVDMAADRIDKAREKSGNRFQFMVMNAEELQFDDASFDTVAIRHSLHHLNNTGKVLSEMRRVLKPGGLFVACEVYQSPETEAENSQRHMHHWWAAVDRVLGVPHFDTFTRPEILEAVDRVGLHDKEIFDYLDDFDAADRHEAVRQMIAISNDCIERLKASNGPAKLVDKGNELIERFARMGYSDESVVYVLGRK